MSEPRAGRRTTLVLAGVVGLVAVIAVVAAVALSGGSAEKSAAAQPSGKTEITRLPSPLSSRQVPPPPPQPVHVPVGQPPGTIRLPDGGTAELVREELDRSGTLPVPDGLDEATWWGAGLDAPEGATVLAGHVNWNGRTGPFAALWDVSVGERVTVTGEDGREFTYRISELVTVDKNELPQRATELFGQAGQHRLVLVTCGGSYVGGEQGYSENRIVIATPV